MVAVIPSKIELLIKMIQRGVEFLQLVMRLNIVTANGLTASYDPTSLRYRCTQRPRLCHTKLLVIASYEMMPASYENQLLSLGTFLYTNTTVATDGGNHRLEFHTANKQL
jgi:hypothetical protein